jgi:hypothetical protein
MSIERKRNTSAVRNGNAVAIHTLTKGKETKSARERDIELQATEEITNPARVDVELGLTKNLGDYNSLRVTVRVSYPCEATVSAITRTKQKVSELVQQFIDEEFEEAESHV